jgi:hypothetical protein
MSDTKYVRTNDGDIIVFHASIPHSKFARYNPVSAGFISFRVNKLGNPACVCYGESESLGLESFEDPDTWLAMRQIIGYEAFEVDENMDEDNQ